MLNGTYIAGTGNAKAVMYFRMAQGVLSREDPVESFLKVVPSDCTQVDIIYPVRECASSNLDVLQPHDLLTCKRCWYHADHDHE